MTHSATVQRVRRKVSRQEQGLRTRQGDDKMTGMDLERIVHRRLVICT
jgi:hypothetical protein